MMQPPRDVLVFGASGQIGAALVARFALSRGAARVHRISWREATTGGLERISAEAMDFVFASGLTDPALGAGELLEANLRFPQSVARWSASKGRNADRFLTLGSILERFPELCRKNAYLASKLAQAEWINLQDPARFAHVRLHTVYGGTLKPHMFLGQMAAALRKNEPFRMSSGNQLREFHRAGDIALFLDELLGRGAFDGPIIELSSGDPVRLVDLARAVFRAFGREHLLEVGSLPLPPGENVNQRFAPSPLWFSMRRRDAIGDIIRLLDGDAHGIRGC